MHEVDAELEFCNCSLPDNFIDEGSEATFICNLLSLGDNTDLKVPLNSLISTGPKIYALWR